MDRHPSASSAISNRSIRRRSGAINLGTDPTLRSSSSISNNYAAAAGTKVENAELVGDGKATIFLVRKPERAPARSPPLPFSVIISSLEKDATPLGVRNPTREGLLLHLPKPPQIPGPIQEADTPVDDKRVVAPFSTVPLTPHQPAAQPNRQDSYSTQTSRLPSPKFIPQPSYQNRVSFAEGQRPSQHARMESASSVASGSSGYSTWSSSSSGSNSKRCHVVFPDLSTADKLTQKFPISGTVKKLTTRGITGALEEAVGLGIESVERWTAHKWWLFVSVSTIFCYGVVGLSHAMLTWFQAWEQAEVMYVADYDILVLITLSSSILLLTFIVGITGTLLNSRPILAVYALLLWPALISILAIGYTAYKRYAFSLDRKLNLAWSQWYTPLGRLSIQDSLRCCGYNSPLHEATASPRCYARAMLDGCKGKLYRFERANLRAIWTVAFGIVPLHLANIFAALLCANHVTKRFGKGIMPRQYRLSGADVKADAEKILGTIREMGAIARPAVSRSPASAMFRRDKKDIRAALKKMPPAALRPGIVPCANSTLSVDSLARKRE